MSRSMVLKHTFHCKLCNERIINPGSTVYCREKKTVDCPSCQKAFTYECRKRVRVFCSRECSSSSEAKQRSSKLKECKECGDLFVGVYSRLYCQKSIARSCEICGKDFVDLCGRGRKTNSCGPACANLKKDWVSNPKKLSEWKDINRWAVNFAKTNNRKPSMKDLENYFQVRVFPSKGHRELFHLTRNRSSRLEEIVASYLKHKDVTFKRNTRPLDADGAKMEIDFLLSEVSLGIEVQDYATHSKENSSDLTRYGEPYKDAFYHELKRQLAKEQLGIVLIDLWEDEILSGAFTKILDDLLDD